MNFLLEQHVTRWFEVCRGAAADLPKSAGITLLLKGSYILRVRETPVLRYLCGVGKLKPEQKALGFAIAPAASSWVLGMAWRHLGSLPPGETCCSAVGFAK